MWVEFSIKVRREHTSGKSDPVDISETQAKIKSLLSRDNPMPADARSFFESTFREHGGNPAPYLKKLMVTYPSGFHKAHVFWIDDKSPVSAGFIVLLLPEAPPKAVDSLALKLFDEILRVIPKGYIVNEHVLRIEGFDHTFTIVEETAPFLTPDGKAALVIACVLGLFMWVVISKITPPEGGTLKTLYDTFWGLLLNVLASAIFALVALALTWRRRRELAKLNRRVVYSDDNVQ